MKGRRIIGAAFLGLLLLVGWLVLRERERARRAERGLAAAQSEIARMRGQIARLTARENETVRSAGAPVSEKQNMPVGANASSANPKATGTRTRPWLSRLFAEQPGLHALYLDAYRKDLELRHAFTLRALGLTAEEVARVIEILARDQERVTDIAAATRARNMASVDAPIKTLTAERLREREAALKAVLGERYDAWQRASGPNVVNQTVEDTIAALHATAQPLTFAQSLRLWKILNGPDGIGWRVAGNAIVEPTDANYALVTAHASRVLSPEQLATLESVLAGRQALEKLRGPMVAPRR